MDGRRCGRTHSLFPQVTAGKVSELHEAVDGLAYPAMRAAAATSGCGRTNLAPPLWLAADPVRVAGKAAESDEAVR